MAQAGRATEGTLEEEVRDAMVKKIGTNADPEHTFTPRKDNVGKPEEH